MERTNTLKITLVFLATIVLPSILLAFFAIRAIRHESQAVRKGIVTRFEGMTRSFVDQMDRAVVDPTKEIRRIFRPLANNRPGDLEALRTAIQTWTAGHPVYNLGAILDEQGNVVHPGLGATRPTALDYGRLDVLFQRAETLEFKFEQFAEAIEEWKEILREHPADPLIQAEALSALSRLYYKQGDAFNAKLKAEELLSRNPMARDREGTLLFPILLDRIAKIWRTDLRNPGRSESTMLRLLRLLAEHRGEISPSVYDGWVETALDSLDLEEPEVQATLKEVKAIEKKVARAHEFRRLIERRFHPELLKALAGKSPPNDFLKVQEGDRPEVLYYTTLTAPGEVYPYALAALRLDLEVLRDRIIGEAIQGFRDEDGYLVLKEDRSPSPERTEAQKEKKRLAAQTLAYPLDHLKVRAFLTDYSSLDELTNRYESIYFWAIVLSIAAIGSGVFLTTRTVLQEMRVSALKTDFVTTITHELKTPLTSIGMFIETLQSGRIKDEEEVEECLDVMARETNRLSSLIDRVLNFSKVESRTKRYDFKLVETNEMIQKALEVFANHINPDDVDLEVNNASEPSIILVDRTQMQEVLLNLLTNAYKYGGHEGQRRTIKINVKARKRTVLIEVEDNGPGIPKSEQRHIFKKFYRGADTYRREIEGTGIGLTLSRAVARAHKGDLWVQSKEGEGARFVLELPRIKEKKERT